MGMGPGHRQLRDNYVRELSQVSKLARNEFEESVETEIARGMSEEDARMLVRKRRGPPAAHPRVLAVIRKYFFACDSLNAQLENEGSDDFVYPLVFVHEMLTGKHQDLWEFLAELDYFPIGVDREERWV